MLLLTNDLKVINFLQVEIQCRLRKSMNNKLLQADDSSFISSQNS